MNEHSLLTLLKTALVTLKNVERTTTDDSPMNGYRISGLISLITSIIKSLEQQGDIADDN